MVNNGSLFGDGGQIGDGRLNAEAAGAHVCRNFFCI